MVEDIRKDLLLKQACTKIADGIAELQNLGLTQQHVMNGIKRQLEAFYKEPPRATGNENKG